MAFTRILSTVALISVLQADAFNSDTRIPEDPFFFTGSDHTTPYNDGESWVFPDSEDFNEEQLQYFSDRMDFDTFNNRLMIGAADKLYLLDSALQIADEFDWPADNTSVAQCETRPSIVAEYSCRNHIRIYHQHPTEEDLLYICGSQAAAEKAQCRGLDINGNAFGDASSPADVTANIISSEPNYPSLGQFRKLDENDTAFISWNYQVVNSDPTFDFNMHNIVLNESTQTFSNPDLFGTRPHWLDSRVNVVDMFPIYYGTAVPATPNVNYNFFYVFLRERHQFALEEREDSEILILSRVLRICIDDPGVLLSAGMAPPSNSFSTLLKTRIYCDQLVPSSTNNPAGAVDLRYNDLWSVTLNAPRGGRIYPSQNYDRKLYAAFSGHLTGPAGTAICAYATAPSDGGMRNGGLFDAFLNDINLYNSEEEAENVFPGCDGRGRPAENDIRVSAEDFMLAQTMTQIGENPMVVFDSIYITQMTVDEMCVVSHSNRSVCHNQDVLFIGTSTGAIRKVVFTESVGQPFTPILSEEVMLEDDSYIQDMNISDLSDGRYLFVVTSSRVYKLSLERCARHGSYEDCLGSRDPYCVWNARENSCQASNLAGIGAEAGEVPAYIVQNIHLGYIRNTSEVSLERSEYTVSEGDRELVVSITANDTVPNGWLELVALESGTDNVVYTTGVSFSDSNPLITTASVPIESDSIYTGEGSFTISLRNTVQGSVIFNTLQAVVTVIDDDGLIAQIGISALDDACSTWLSKGYSLENVDRSILQISTLRDAGFKISSSSISCSSGQLRLLNSAIYRITLQPAVPDIDVQQVQRALEVWVGDEEEIELLEPSGAIGPMIKIDSTCFPVVISSLQDELCTFSQVIPGGLGGSDSSGLSGGGVAAVLLAVAAIILVVVVVVLAILLYRANSSGSMDIEIATSPTHTKDMTYTGNGDFSSEEKKRQKALESSDNSHVTSSPTSPVPPEQINSAVPLVHNGVESKKNMFPFTLNNPPLTRRDSPKVRTSVLSQDPNVVMESPRGKKQSVLSESCSVFSDSGAGRSSVPVFADGNYGSGEVAADASVSSLDTKV